MPTNKFILYIVEETGPWVTLYEEKRKKSSSEWKSLRWLNGITMPYLNHLKENMPKIFPNYWVADKIQEKHAVLGCNPCGEYLDTKNIGIICNNSVSTTFNLYYFTF
jgi:hypothetical protein